MMFIVSHPSGPEVSAQDLTEDEEAEAVDEDAVDEGTAEDEDDEAEVEDDENAELVSDVSNYIIINTAVSRGCRDEETFPPQITPNILQDICWKWLNTWIMELI